VSADGRAAMCRGAVLCVAVSDEPKRTYGHGHVTNTPTRDDDDDDEKEEEEGGAAAAAADDG